MVFFMFLRGFVSIITFLLYVEYINNIILRDCCIVANTFFIILVIPFTYLALTTTVRRVGGR